jgi:hypothetical protein
VPEVLRRAFNGISGRRHGMLGEARDVGMAVQVGRAAILSSAPGSGMHYG